MFDFTISNNPDYYDRDPTTAALPDGGFVTVWTDGLNSSAKGQGYLANTVTFKTDITISGGSPGGMGYSYVHSLPDGGFVVGWQGKGVGSNDDDDDTPYLRFFDKFGNPTTGDIRVADARDGDVYLRGIEILADNSIIVLTEFDVFAKARWGHAVTWFDQKGAVVRDTVILEEELQTLKVNGFVTHRTSVKIVPLDDGGFMTVYKYNDTNNLSIFEVYANTFEADGAPRGSETMLSDIADYGLLASFDAPRVADLGNGQLLVVWDTKVNDLGGVRDRFYSQEYRLIDQNGQPISEIKLLDEFSNARSEKINDVQDVVALGGGYGGIVYSDWWEGSAVFEDYHDIVMQVIDPKGDKVGEPIKLNANLQPDPARAEVTFLAGGEMMTTFHAAPGNYENIYATFFQSGDSADPDALLRSPEANLFRDLNSDKYVQGASTKDVLVGNANDERLFAWAKDDAVFGGAGDDTLNGGGGADLLDGGFGIDTAEYVGNRASYSFSIAANGTTRITGGPDGGDTLIDIERVKFADQTVGFLDLFPGAASGGAGYDPIYFFNAVSQTLGVFEMPSAQWRVIGTTGAGWEVRGIGSFDADDMSADVLWYNTNSRSVGRFDMDGTSNAGWSLIGQAGLGWEVVGAGDFNGDDTDDILWFNAATSKLGQYRMLNGEANWASVGGTGSGWEIKGIGDINGDGVDDILWWHANTRSLGQFRMQETGASWQTVAKLGVGYEVAETGDFDGDGTDDILVFNQTTGRLGMFDMGGGAPGWIALGTAGAGWAIAGTGDFDSNGTDDILWRHVDGRIGQYQMYGSDFTWDEIGRASGIWEALVC